MSDQLLAVLRIGLLVLIYLFFLRVLRAVWVEVRAGEADASARSHSVGGFGASVAAGASAPSIPAASIPAAGGAAQGVAAADRPIGVMPSSQPPPVPKATRKTPSYLRRVDPAGPDVALAGGVLVGRSPACNLLADQEYVSHQHARFTWSNGVVILEDLGSTNGTFVNDQQVTIPTVISVGDRVRFGSAVVEVV